MNNNNNIDFQPHNTNDWTMMKKAQVIWRAWQGKLDKNFFEAYIF